MIPANEKACERLQIIEQMLCLKEFTSMDCMSCDYYYVEENDGYRVARCLKKNIRDWTLYRIDKGCSRK